MIRKIVWISLLLILLLIGLTIFAQNNDPDTVLHVFAASSLTESFNEIAQAFEKSHPGISVSINFAGSQVLTTQLENGVEADLFAPAGNEYIKKTQDKGLIENPQVYAQNKMVLAISNENQASIKDLSDLAEPYRIIMVVKDAPAGSYALKVLDKCTVEWGAAYKEKVLENVISYETNVKQVVNKIILGEADAGFVYYSDIVQPEKDGKLSYINIPDNLNITAEYSLGIVTGSKQKQPGQEFQSFVLSKEGQDILNNYGLGL